MNSSEQGGWLEHGAALCIIGAAVLFSFSHLTETPPTWMDEGIITQVARSVATDDYYGIQVAPEEFVSAGFVSTSYPVVLPIAQAFRLWGTDLAVARFVMVVYLALFLLVSYALIARIAGFLTGLLSLILLATFAPVYGHGINVLGEIPGLFFFIWGLYALDTSRTSDRFTYWVGMAFFSFGLFVATKPIFILVLPALLIGLFIHMRGRSQKVRVISVATVALLVPIIFWVWIQFSGESVSQMLSIYSNPHSNTLFIAIVENLRRIGTEVQPTFMVGLFAVWLLSGMARWWRDEEITVSEIIAFIFSSLVLLAYVRTMGYYRYFFPAQVFGLLFLPIALGTFLRTARGKMLLLASVIVLASFNLYATLFDSWVADHRFSTRAAVLREFFSQQDVKTTYFIYQAPEVVPFIPSSQFWQFFNVTKTIRIGEESLFALEFALPDILISDANEKLSTKFYRQTSMVDRYAVYERMK